MAQGRLAKQMQTLGDEVEYFLVPKPPRGLLMDFESRRLKDDEMAAILEGGDISVAGPPAVAKDGDATAGAELTWDGAALESASFGMPGDRFGRIGLRQALGEADAVAVGVETIEVVEDHGLVAMFP
jgi:hypothetical protein